MLIAKLQGGMGNQCFIYAAAKKKSIELQCNLALNTSSFQNDPLGRMYSLGLWRGVIEPIINDPIYTNIVKEKGLPYNKQVWDSINSCSIMDGYWQTEKYFYNMTDYFRKVFIPKQELTTHSIYVQNQIRLAGDRSVFLTVRRTDYLTSDFHGILSMDYYLTALDIISKEVDPEVFIFSDDPEWCKAYFKIPYSSIVAGNYNQTNKDHLGREDEELTLMSHCKHAVLANSSYSWWGAWLNPNPGKIIAPKTWFLSTKEDPRDIVPDRWIRL
jgi:hypothetical protein